MLYMRDNKDPCISQGLKEENEGPKKANLKVSKVYYVIIIMK